MGGGLLLQGLGEGLTERGLYAGPGHCAGLPERGLRAGLPVRGLEQRGVYAGPGVCAGLVERGVYAGPRMCAGLVEGGVYAGPRMCVGLVEGGVYAGPRMCAGLIERGVYVGPGVCAGLVERGGCAWGLCTVGLCTAIIEQELCAGLPVAPEWGLSERTTWDLWDARAAKAATELRGTMEEGFAEISERAMVGSDRLNAPAMSTFSH